MNNNKRQIDSLNKLLKLSTEKKIQITEPMLTSAYETLSKHGQLISQFCYLSNADANAQLHDCKNIRKLIVQSKSNTNHDDDIGKTSDDEYESNLQDLFNKIRKFHNTAESLSKN